jgi:co-chaperonin GroES (HSP10)
MVMRMSKEKKVTIHPCGTKILIKIIPYEEVSKGGIVLGTTNELERERKGRDLGELMSIGPLAFKGYKGCLDLGGPSDWGVEVGDIVEYRRYDGKIPRSEGYENYRYLDDEDVIAVIKDIENKKDKS